MINILVENYILLDSNISIALDKKKLKSQRKTRQNINAGNDTANASHQIALRIHVG